MSYLNIKDEKLLPTITELNTLLADYSLYYQKLRSFHWNVLGHNFFSKRIMNIIFKLLPLDIFSASASAIAIK